MPCPAEPDWAVPKRDPVVGGAMDLAIGAKQSFVRMILLAKGRELSQPAVTRPGRRPVEASELTSTEPSGMTGYISGSSSGVRAVGP